MKVRPPVFASDHQNITSLECIPPLNKHSNIEGTVHQDCQEKGSHCQVRVNPDSNRGKALIILQM